MTAPNQEAPTDEAEVEKPAEESTEVETPDEKPSDEPAEKDSEDGGDDLPDWAREKLTKANAEAANYRTKLREAEDKLKNAKSLEEVDTLLKEMGETREKAERELLVENVALKFKLPEKLAKRLQGKTREELEADAKELAEFAEDEDEDVELEGGLSPRDRDSDPDDPRALAAKYGSRRKRR